MTKEIGTKKVKISMRIYPRNPTQKVRRNPKVKKVKKTKVHMRVKTVKEGKGHMEGKNEPKFLIKVNGHRIRE